MKFPIHFQTSIDSFLIISFGSNFQILKRNNENKFEKLFCSSSLSQDSSRHTATIRCIAIDKNYESEKTLRFASVGDDKRVFVWQFDYENSKIVCAQQTTLKKKSVTCVFAGETNATLIVGDKFGDGFAFHVGDSLSNKIESFENSLEPEFGQLSTIITSCKLPNGDFAFGEKDEKIIIAKCPKVYEYKHFCLGHKSFVSSIRFTKIDSLEILISSDGLGNVCVWSLEGKSIGESLNLKKSFQSSEEDTNFAIQSLCVADNLVLFVDNLGRLYAASLKVVGNDKKSVEWIAIESQQQTSSSNNNNDGSKNVQKLNLPDNIKALSVESMQSDLILIGCDNGQLLCTKKSDLNQFEVVLDAQLSIEVPAEKFENELDFNLLYGNRAQWMSRDKKNNNNNNNDDNDNDNKKKDEDVVEEQKEKKMKTKE